MYTWELIENRPDWISQWNFRIWRYLKCSSQLRIYALNFCKFVWSANKWKNVLMDKKIANDNICLSIQNDHYVIYYMFLMGFFFFWGGGLFCLGHYSKIYMYQLTMTQFVIRIFEVSNISTLWINTFHVSNFLLILFIPY